ncbi:MAG: hypothetical protein WCO56_07600 [Verrucomicrobiota bacterium]
MNQAPQVKAEIQSALAAVASRMLPRILTAICRDPNSPCYGAADRDWWHYKIRDFPSLILQQGGYALWQAAALEAWREDAPALRALAAASCRFWNQRAIKFRAFEEYYPWEEGYPPLAFSTLAVAKLVAEQALPVGDVLPGLRVAARQLQIRFESEAANQQVAGLAALAWVRKVAPELVAAARFEEWITRSLALQHDEGWFREYGGPDLGYLAVTLDCLFDLLDATGDARFARAIQRALAFIVTVTDSGRVAVGLHNARNTDYLVPYGLVRASLDASFANPGLTATVERLFGNAADPSHFFAAVDDRYCCHYIGQSVVRVLAWISRQTGDAPAKDQTPTISPVAATFPSNQMLPGAGYWLVRENVQAGGWHGLVALRKGGIITAARGASVLADFGWIYFASDGQHISHWWSDDWKFSCQNQTAAVEGSLYVHRETASSPFSHIALRGLSLVFGRQIIQMLKRLLIFKKPQSPVRFCRQIEFSKDEVRVTDRFTGLPANPDLRRAPRTSKRHVASADSFHAEDLRLLRGVQYTEERREAAGVLTVVTIYRLG